ncbi:MAG: hypothetical protein AAGF88_11705 [Pseudomonadota bacterium]
MALHPLQLIVPIALKETIEAFAGEIAGTLGIRVEMVHMLNPEVPAFIRAGAAWDLALSNPWHLAEILEEPGVDVASHRAFGRSPLAFGVRGAPASQSPRDTRQEIIAALDDAQVIAITAGGTSGDMFQQLLGKLGPDVGRHLAIRQLPGGGPMRALLASDVDLVALPLSNIAPISGAYAKAVCPVDLGVHIDLSLCCRAGADRHARALADWLTDVERAEHLRRLGVLPLPAQQMSMAPR